MRYFTLILLALMLISASTTDNMQDQSRYDFICYRYWSEIEGRIIQGCEQEPHRECFVTVNTTTSQVTFYCRGNQQHTYQCKIVDAAVEGFWITRMICRQPRRANRGSPPTYTVVGGDSYFRIGGKVCGNQRMAYLISKANGHNDLRAGMKLTIPKCQADPFVPQGWPK